MSRAAYIWIILAVGLAFWFHSHEESTRRAAINKATTDALYVGVKAGCRSNNKIIHQVIMVADKLHPSAADEVKAALKPQHCQQQAARIVVRYEQVADH